MSFDMFYDSTYVVHFKDQLPDEADMEMELGACANAWISDGRLVLDFRGLNPFQDHTAECRFLGDRMANWLGTEVDYIVLAEIQQAGDGDLMKYTSRLFALRSDPQIESTVSDL